MAMDAARMGTRLRTRAPRPPRLVFLTIILLSHAVAIYYMGWRTHAPRVAQGSEFPALPIYIVPMPELERTEPRNVKTHPVRVKPPEPQESAAIATPLPKPAPDNEQARPDWANEAKQAAQRLARSQYERKGMGAAPEDDAPTKRPSDGIYEKENPHRAGDVQVLGQGIERRWISPRCYREFGHIPKPYTGTGINTLPITCLGPSPPRGDLFEDLKPDYLKKGTRY